MEKNYKVPYRTPVVSRVLAECFSLVHTIPVVDPEAGEHVLSTPTDLTIMPDGSLTAIIMLPRE